jgi:hypothetical protein
MATCRSDKKETDVLKKTCATGVLALTAAAGALLTSSPASAQVPAGGGWGGCCGGSWNSNHVFNHTRVNVENHNNNIAIAKNGERDGFGVDGLFAGGFDFDDD